MEQKFVELIDRLRGALTSGMPFIGSLVRKSRIIVHSDKFLPGTSTVAGVDKDSVIHLSEGFFELPVSEAGFILAHEASHASLRHAARVGERNRELFNVSADVVINHLLEEQMAVPHSAVTGYALRLPQGWETWSVEEVYEFLKKRGGNGEGRIGKGKGDLLTEKPEGGETIQEGDPSLYEDGEENRERRWREAIAQAAMVAKQAGKLPAGLARFVDEMLKPKVPVRSLLRQYIREGIGKTVVGTWTRESRKTPDMPGIRRFTVPNIWALVDTSGSIGEEELSLFVGTIYEFNSLSNITVVCWDGEAYEPIKLKQRTQVLEKLKKKMRGGGGTTIIPALKKVLKEMRGLNIVLVLTDGYIFDWDNAGPYLTQVARKSLSSILLWTGEEIKHPLWKSIKLA